MLKVIPLALCSVLFFAAPGSSKKYRTSFDNVTWDDGNWQLATTNLDQGHYQARKSLANGYLGINVAATGPFFEVDTPVAGDIINGWPLWDRRQTFATIAGFYATQSDTNGTNYPWLLEFGGESVIAGVPHWGNLMVESNGHVLNASTPASQIAGFQSKLDMKAATMSWSYTWAPPGGVALGIEYTMLVHKLYVNMGAVQLKINATQDTNVTIIDALNGDCAVRSQFVDKGIEEDSIWSAVHPHWVGNVTAYIYSTLQSDGSLDMSTKTNYTNTANIGGNMSSIATAVIAQVKGGKNSIIAKFIGGASTDAFPDPQATARNASISGAVIGFDCLLQEQKQEWATVMPPDSVDSYVLPNTDTLPEDFNIIQLQITAVTNPFNLIQNTIGTNAIAAAGNNTKLDIWSIPVCGLGSSCYAGQIFWDAEVWMAPGLVVSNPQAAKQIANYRVQLFPQAKSNIGYTASTSRNATTFTTGGAVFPWTSGKYGNCTAAGPCFDYEYHINGDIGLELLNFYIASGDVDYFREYLFPIYDAVAYFYGEVLTLDQTLNKYFLTNATDPDEYANNVDNPAFTMALMQTHLNQANVLRGRFGMPLNDTWTKQAPDIYVPTDPTANIILEYGTMNGTISVKQADVVLVDDFLDYPNPYSLSDLDYYAGKQSLNGPGMTYGVYSIVANEISPSGCSSYTYDLYGTSPYVRAPWYEYSEQLIDNYNANGGTHPAFPFLTGMGGAHRVAVFGYLGLRMMVDTLNVDPNLPPQLTNLNYRTIYWQGHAIDARSNVTHTTLKRLPVSLPHANTTYATNPIPVTIGMHMNTVIPLAPNGTVVIENRRIGYNQTVKGNIAQCKMVSSEEQFLDGQFPLAAVDGAISTKWQPVLANKTAVLVVELTEPAQPIKRISFDWAQSPPAFYSVTFSNSTTDFVHVSSSSDVKISNPYVAADASRIVPYSGNTTDVTIDPPVWSGKFATLTILGSQTEEYAKFQNGSGATVAEWAIIGLSGDVTMKAKREFSKRSDNMLWTYEGGKGGPGLL